MQIIKKKSLLRFLLKYALFIVHYIEKRSIMRNEMIELGAAIQERRDLLGLLQTQLAALSGVSTRTIQLVEQGKGNPSLETLHRLAEPLGLCLKLVLKAPSQTNNNV